MPSLTRENILAMLDDFTAAWNQGDLPTACECYDRNASFISNSGGYICGKQKILERYRNAYPDRSAMGTLTLEIIEFRANRAPGNEATMATVILRWKVQTQNGQEKSGFALEVYKKDVDGRILLVQDATV